MTASANAASIDLAAIAPAWRAFRGELPIRLGAIRSQAEYKRVVAFMNGLLDVVGDDEAHELAGLLDLVGSGCRTTTTPTIPFPTPRPMRCCAS